jgi:hypothetical protein
MKDLLLFRLLRAPELDPAALAPLLDELAGLPVAGRFPFLGLLPRALAHADPGLRAAALRALAGADGRAAFLLLIGALADADPGVRRAAVEALRASSLGHPARWVHALYHPLPDVRRAAIDGPFPPATAVCAFGLLADPVCGPELLRRLEAPAPDGEDAPGRPVVPPSSLSAVFDFVASGSLPAPLARLLVADMPWSGGDRWFLAARRRSPDEVAAVLASAVQHGGPDPGPGADAFDELFDLFGDDPTSASESLFRQLSAHLGGWSPDILGRVIASLLVVSRRRGAFAPGAAGILAVYHPRFFAFTWVPRADRHAAVKAIYASAGHVPRLPDAEVKALLGLDLCRRPGGGLDLWVIGGLLHFLEQRPYDRALRWLGTDAVIEAFVADIEYAVPFLSLHDDGKRGRRYILERASRARPLARGFLLALLTLATPAAGLGFLEQLGAAEAAAVLVELLRLLRRPELELAPKKLPVVARLAVEIAPQPALMLALLGAWLEVDAPEASPLGLSVLGALGVALPAPGFVELALALPAPMLPRLLRALPHCATFPYGKELALAYALADHPDEAARAWARDRIPASAEALPVARPPPTDVAVPRLPVAVLSAVATCSDADLPAAVRPSLDAPSAGLCDALGKRRPPAAAQVEVCAAILGSHDPMERVDAELARFGSTAPAFLSALDAQVVRIWEREENLPPLGHAWIHRWERHAFAFVAQLAAAEGLAAGLLRTAALSSEALRASAWDAVASAFAMWRWRDRPRLAGVCTEGLGDVLVQRLDTDVGEGAARALTAIAEARVAPDLVERLRPVVAEKLPDLAASTRAVLASWLDVRGICGGGAVRAANVVVAGAALLAAARASTDLDALEAWCSGDDARLAEEAALRLIELGEPGLARLLAVIEARPPAQRALIESVPLWPEGPALARARSHAREAGPDELRFRLAAALAERGERGFVPYALAAARVETDETWFRADDWRRLLALGETERSLSLSLAASPHPHAYRLALGHLLAVLEHLLATPAPPEILEATRAFLEAGTERMTPLRRRAARWLMLQGDDAGFPVLLDEAADPKITHFWWPEKELVDPALIAAAVEAVLLGGARAVNERLALTLLDDERVDPEARSLGYERLLAEATTEAVRAAAVTSVVRGELRSAKLRALAETFAWGIRAGRELTGRLFKVEMIAGKGLGYTRFEESRVFVSPLPILRDAANGREIVEGLILHELGHHRYHRGEEEGRAWKTAEQEGIFGLLNLVADEHLERNLRGVDAGYGDRLKRLGAYAFLHADKDVPAGDLLDSLGGRAFEVLTGTSLEAAREEGCVRVTSGAILLQMERAGLAFPRFFRALRMGLGDRHDDPLARAGLALCKGVRRRTMAELLTLARELRALFGWQTQLLEHFGPHESLEGGEAERTILGEGITQQELDAEIERVLDPDRRRREGAGAGGRGGKLWINVSPDERFSVLHTVVKVARDPAEHAAYAAQVLPAARRMRRWLDELGVTLEKQRMRLRGRRFDPSRALALVVRGDPRMLIAREPVIRTDLFIGVLVDCSGSMQTRGNIEKAKLFGAMLAEAARGAPGVDVRFFGFTDSVIYDAGDAARCAVHALRADGGNNDAGALWHAATVARESRRRAKLLVMISDGLPTECSAAALRALVSRLGNRMGICCAQVAVQRLTETCFPHYVVLEEQDPGPAVRRFGAIVADLVKKAMAIA